MSTRSSIYAEGHSHVYEETSEPKEQWGKFVGYTIYAELSTIDLKGAMLTPELLTFNFYPDSQFAVDMGATEWQVNPSDIESIEYDCEGDLILTIKAGSFFAKKLQLKRPNMTNREVFSYDVEQSRKKTIDIG